MKVRNSLAGLGMSVVLALGVGGAIAPGAQAVTPTTAKATSVTANADFTAVNTKTHRKTHSRSTQSSSARKAAPRKQASLRCWNPSIRGRSFSVTCSGRAFRVFVNCSNGVRYHSPVYSGTHRVTGTCPAGSRATGGGAYGR